MTFIDGAKLRPQPRQSDAPTTPPRPKATPSRGKPELHEIIRDISPQEGQAALRRSYAARKGKHIAEQYGLGLEDAR